MTKFLIGVAAFVLAFQFGMRYVLTYRFTDTRVEAVLFRVLPVSSTRYDRITGVTINAYMRMFIGWAVCVRTITSQAASR